MSGRMSILAEPKRKNRISVDPQNQQWAQDGSKFGRKLMEKMGWSKGEGLGKSGRGMTENLKLKANTTGKGLGALNSYDSTWISHHDDFADLLSALNKNKPNKEDDETVVEEKTKQVSLELKSKSLKRRIHYQKFTRAKDITEYDDNAKKAVLGIGIKKKNKHAEKQQSDSDDKTEPASSNPVEPATQNHSVSSVSASDYYKDKMAAKLAALRGTLAESADPPKKKKKLDEETTGVEDENQPKTEEKVSKKKKKRTE